MESACVAGGASDPGETGMKRQLQVVVALAVLGVSLAAANAAADGVKLGVGGSDVSIDLPDGLGLEDLCAQLIGQGASVGTLLEAGCTPPEQPDGTDPGRRGRHRRRAA